MNLYPCAEYGCRYNGFGLCQFCPDRGEPLRSPVAFGLCPHFSDRREAARTGLAKGWFRESGGGPGFPGGGSSGPPGPWPVI